MDEKHSKGQKKKLETISERKEKNQQLQAAGDSNRDTDRVTG
jgi:hypothetical protein